MFNKALFKQSVKANGIMWTIITLAVCFMLSCVMLISGSGNISKTKDAVEDTIVKETIDGHLKNKSVSTYVVALNGVEHFDSYFVNETKIAYQGEIENVKSYVVSTETWLASQPQRDAYGNDLEYASALSTWKNSYPKPEAKVEEYYLYFLNNWLTSAPVASSFDNASEYAQAVTVWKNQKPNAVQAAFACVVKEDIVTVYTNAISDLTMYLKNYSLSVDPTYDENSEFYTTIYGATMFAINPNGAVSERYEAYEKNSTPEDYDVASILENVTATDLVLWAQNKDAVDVSNYISSSTRRNYRQDRVEESVSILVAGSMFEEEHINAILETLDEYGVTKEKFFTLGYTYDGVKHANKTSIVSYQARFDYEVSCLDRDSFDSEEAYNAKIVSIQNELVKDITNSLLEALPDDVADAIKEIGQMDLYSLIVGSIFFKMAGLLLPIIYMIMVSNNLVAGQVDTGSMAYVLSTSTKRKEVVFTQGLFLISSLFLMFVCTCITSCVCFSIVNISSTSLTYGKLVLMNLGAFLVLFAMSGINFLTSCWFDRSKRSMAIGGGVSMFFLVATMLGLFGSSVIPSVVRLSALNNFNYVSIISLFDAVSIIDGTTVFVYKFVILLVIGVVGYFVGSYRFQKKDLPL